MLRFQLGLAGISLACAALAVAAHADEPKEKAAEAGPVYCVELAPAWEQALKDAKARVVPMVVHVHGFYCGPCWHLHRTVMCDKGYIEFSFENAVEVLALDRLQEGVDKGEDGAGTYEAKRDGKRLQFLRAFPTLTIDEALQLRQSKAGSYNKTGGLPYTALIDPFTEEELKSWQGGSLTVAQLTQSVTDARDKLVKDHGKGKARPELKVMVEAEVQGEARIKAGNYAGALDTCDAFMKKAEKDGWAPYLHVRILKTREAAIAAATAALDKVDADKSLDPVKTKKDLATLVGKLRGTGLEKRAKALLATL
jgi:hypothetical protein